MRITGGTHRGRVLLSPQGSATRPTSDRAREALFNILIHASWTSGPVLDDACVLDAFAGTGALALDALSRGAKQAVMMDKSPQAAKLCTENAEKLGLAESCTVIRADALKPPPRPLYIEPRTLVFLDPPYAKGLGAKALAALTGQDWLASRAIVVMEMAKRAPEDVPEYFTLLDERAYGIAMVRFLRWEG